MKFEEQLLEISHIALIDGDRGKNYPKHNDFKEGIGDCLFLSAKNVTLSGFSFEDRVFIDREKDAILRAGKLSRNDIVLTTRGTIGNVALYDESVSYNSIRINSGMLIFRADPKVWRPKFLYFLMTSPYFKNQIKELTSGSAVPQLPARDLKKFRLPKVNIYIQQRIEKIIGDIANKIILNRQINQTLEAMAQALFKSWFVDFEPVKAKMAALSAGGNEEDANLAAMSAISGKSAQALLAMQTNHPEQYQQLYATAELFPSEMVESELGEIPKGWTISILSNIANFANGRIAVSELNRDNYISTENMLTNKEGISASSSLPEIETVPIFQQGQVLISNIRPYFKKIWMATFNGGRSGDVLAFEANKKEQKEFLYNILYQDSFFDYMMLTSKGAKMPRGDKTAIMNYKTVFPNNNIAEIYSSKVSMFYAQVDVLKKQNLTLNELRDSLLPKLLSGELL